MCDAKSGDKALLPIARLLHIANCRIAHCFMVRYRYMRKLDESGSLLVPFILVFLLFLGEKNTSRVTYFYS